MFDETDFNLPLEKELRLRVINKEIKECSDMEALKENLVLCSASLMKYQHLLSQMIKKQMMAELELFAPEVIKIVDEITGVSDGNRKSKEI